MAFFAENCWASFADVWNEVCRNDTARADPHSDISGIFPD